MTAADPVLIAREAELAALEQALLRVGDHGPAQLVVTGPPGSGRSTLVARYAADHGVGVARGAAWESGLELGVVSQLLGATEVPDDVLGAAAVLADRLGGTAAEPGLLVVDDAQWADPASLQALSSAVRHHRDRPFLVVLVTPSAAPVPETAALLDAVADRVVLRPLDLLGVQALAAAHGVVLHASLAERLRVHTGGLPAPVVRLVEELPRSTWASFDPELPAPADVAADVVARLAALPSDAVALVEGVAVLGDGTSIADAASLAGLTAPLAALDAAVATGLLVVTERRRAHALATTDPMVAAAVVAHLGPARAADLHVRAAGVVSDPASRLLHRVAATALPDPSLADELEDLAGQRASTGAWASAADLLARASRLTDDVTLRELRLARAVDALVGSGDVLAAATLLPEVESLRETPLRNAVLGYLAVVRGRPAEAETWLGRAWDLVNAEREPDVAAMICQRWVLHSLARVRGADLVTWADRAIALVPADSPAAVEAAAIRPLGLAATGHPLEALADYQRLADEVGHGAQAQRVSMGKGWLHLVVDEVDESRPALESALATGFLGGSTRISLWAHAWLARAQFVTGDWDDALRTVRAGLDLVDRSGMTLVRPLLWWTRAQVLALRGDWDGAEAAVRSGEAGVRDYEMMRVPSCLARAQVAEARADYAGVVRALEPLRQPWAGAGIDEPGAWSWPDVYANALVVEGRLDEADEFLRPHEALAEERGHRSATARLGYARGRLLGARGDLDAARLSFERSLDLLADTPLRWDRARVNFAYGQTLRRAGKRREADGVIAAARDLYAALGASTYVARCDRELKAGGLHAVRPADQPVDALTPQEEAVAALVARGLSNREVAAELFVSMKTVQYHLTRVYAKLGVRSRTELAAQGVTSSRS
ncbi:LuxR family transcriptional regulator [Nocardioides sp. Soil777]|uniref:helix-turn-helix transcriptional regulator n=1 Tax=Nocardioides sp. Soil777 TaxID=1736409 RepID=UPI000703BA09|nr:LuxR family transcriptional regulator [Nocardioides sp. Soil777]KRE99042.1 LuxR family transcriptional regulator [Nocardioides sp. Soil777]